MKIANFVLQLLLIIWFVQLFAWMQMTKEPDISIYLIWLLLAGTILGIGTLYKNVKYRLKHRGYLTHLIASIIYIGVVIFLSNDYYNFFNSFSIFGEFGIYYIWLPIPFILACWFTICAYLEIGKRRKTMLEI